MGAVTLPESFPVTLSAAFMVHNDPDNSLYLEGALPFSLGDVELGLTLGVVAGMSGFLRRGKHFSGEHGPICQ